MKSRAPRVVIEIGKLPLPAISELRQANGSEGVRAWIRTYGNLSAVQAQLLSRQDMNRILGDIERQNKERFGRNGND